MPKNMTREEYESALTVMETMCPPPAVKEDIDGAFRPISFDMSAGGSVLMLRLVDAEGVLLDVNFSQAVSVELIKALSKSLHAIDWMDSLGKPTLDPESP